MQVVSATNTTDMEDNSKFYFHKSGNQFRITPKVNLDLHETLPVGTYSINYDECKSQYYLETINDFQLKGKIYGNVVRSSSRILNTFLDRHRSTGVLLVGEKGSGKTLLAQYISIVAAKEKEIPTIVINKPWHGDQFNSFIQNISQPVIILMDEFEKFYTMNRGENHQEKILTLFDGVYASQKLFLLTCNDKHRMDSHMMNRPGRSSIFRPGVLRGQFTLKRLYSSSLWYCCPLPVIQLWYAEGHGGRYEPLRWESIGSPRIS